MAPPADWLTEATPPFLFPLQDSQRRYPVYRAGRGPGVLLLHELPGMSPLFVRLAGYIRDAGFTVYAPLFFGQAGRTDSLAIPGRIARLCVTREFNILTSGGESKVAPWLRALSQHILAERPGRGIGAIGLCLTGNIVLSLMAAETHVQVPIMCEPSTPLHQLRFIPLPGWAASAKKALGVPSADVRRAVERSLTTPLWAFRFDSDIICPSEKFATLRDTFADHGRFEELETGAPGQPPLKSHSVLTNEFAFQPGAQPHDVLQSILARLHEELD